ncbi:Uncharacterised protein [Chlamydia abortus]|nr:Uncharacterised protein [Chlamydia abortus]
MCKRFDNNKEKFVALVNKMGTFSEKQITQAFFELYPSEKIIDENASVKEILYSLREVGTLRFDGLTYKVVPVEHRITTNRFAFHVIP